MAVYINELLIGMGGGNEFKFKRFTVCQDGCAMKVGTDGVLLGAWCRVDPRHDEAMLDVGTGTGVIALQLAQRTEGLGATIDAVEIDARACLAASRNFTASGWSDRLKAYNADVKDFAGDAAHRAKYDHVVSNPPYFVGSLTSPHAGRNTARHAVSVSYGELIRCCSLLLKPSGRVSLIVPAGAETELMVREAALCGFAVSRRTDVHSTPASGPKRTLLEFSHLYDRPAVVVAPIIACHRAAAPAPAAPADADPRTAVTAVTAAAITEPPRTTIVIEDGGPERFSEEYRAMTRDFYLRF